MKDLIKYSIFFLLLYCAPLTQFTYWACILFFPFVFFGFHRKKKNIQLIHLTQLYLVLAVTTFITGLVSPDLYRPTKGACLMCGCAIVSWCVLNTVQNRNQLIKLNNGIIIGTYFFAILVLRLMFKGGFALDYSEEESTFAKNLLAVNFYAGAVCSSVNYMLTKCKRYLLFLISFALLIILSTSLKIVLAVLFLIAISFWETDKKTKLYLIFFLIIVICLYYNTILDFFSSKEGRILLNRIFIFLGMDKYAEIEMQFVDYREGLMKQAMGIFYKHPFGVGLENTRLYMRTYSHNTFIELLCGCFALLGIFMYYCFTIVKTVWRLRKKSSISFLSIGIIASILFIGSAMRIYDNAVAIFLLVYSLWSVVITSRDGRVEYNLIK